MHWSGPENIAQVKINGEGSWALLDSGSTINVVTLEFVKACSLDVGHFEQSGRWYSEDKLGLGDCFPDPRAMSS